MVRWSMVRGPVGANVVHVIGCRLVDPWVWTGQIVHVLGMG